MAGRMRNCRNVTHLIMAWRNTDLIRYGLVIMRRKWFGDLAKESPTFFIVPWKSMDQSSWISPLSRVRHWKLQSAIFKVRYLKRWPEPADTVTTCSSNRLQFYLCSRTWAGKRGRSLMLFASLYTSDRTVSLFATLFYLSRPCLVEDRKISGSLTHENEPFPRKHFFFFLPFWHLCRKPVSCFLACQDPRSRRD